ncbi:MAG TPA: M48 family metalloprotease [Candidatus Tectomicrobia bacterium]|nr:M48 family metalloprotease [Candidatus Tectomicrobia bacterium]
MFRCLVLFLVTLLCGACASHLPPLSASGQSFTLAADEALLWDRATREHRQLSGSAGLLRDPILEEYLAEIVHRLLPPGTREAGVYPSVHVIVNPSLNAFAYPTGAIYLHSGLVARLENEAQLATILAHEVAHIVHRHTIRHLREERNKDLWKRIAVVTTPLVLGPLLAPLGISVSGTNPAILLQRPSVEDFLTDQALDSSLELAARRRGTGRFDHTTALFARTQPSVALLASVRSYQPSLMEEADRFAVMALAQAGYDPREAARTLVHLRAAASAQAAQEPFWWGRPTAYEARRQAILKAIATLPPSVAEGGSQAGRRDPYQERIRLLVRENALAELKVGRIDAAVVQLERILRLQPNDAVAHYYLGRAYAAKASDADELQRAVAAYIKATQVDVAFADAYRELAMTYGKLGDVERAAEARQAYVSLRGEMAFFPVTGLTTMGIRPLPLSLPGTTELRP